MDFNKKLTFFHRRKTPLVLKPHSVYMYITCKYQWWNVKKRFCDLKHYDVHRSSLMQLQFYIWMVFAWKHIPNLKLLSCLSTYRDRKGAHPERMFMKTKHDRTLRSAQFVADLRTPKIRNHMNLLCKNKDVVFVVCNRCVMYSGNALIKDGCAWFFVAWLM